MKKKIFTLLLAVAASVGTMFAWDYENVQIGDLYYNLDATNQTAEVTSQNSSYPYWSTTITTANIPSLVTYNSVSYSVTSIGVSAFHYCSSLTSVTIPNSVTSIGVSAFLGCTGLTSVTIGNSVTSIESQAFYGCTGLTSVTIPNSVTSIGGWAFRNCSGLTSPVYNAHVFAFMPTSYSGAYTIPDGIESIAGYAFYGCSGLTSVTIPNSVTSIGNYAFSGCSGLTSVTIPNSVTSIGNYAFRNCIGLTSPVYNAHVFAFMPTSYSGAYTIPDGIESIAGFAFYGCSGLTSVTIPNSVPSIGENAFRGCTGLTSVTIPNSVTSIGSQAFYECTGLTSVTIPNSVTSIGGWAFRNCSGLTSVTIEAETPPTLGSDVFYYTNNCPIYVPCGTLEAYKTAWADYADRIRLRVEYTITGKVNDANAGSVDYPTSACGDVVITAVPNNGYHFTQWSDGNTDNPRTIELTQDTTFTAEFARNLYFVQFFGFNQELLSSQEVEYGTAAVAPEAPIVDHYDFVGWDKDFTNVTGDLDVYAIYQKNTEDVENVDIDGLPVKVLHDGQIFILRGDKTYTLTGQEVR